MYRQQPCESISKRKDGSGPQFLKFGILANLKQSQFILHDREIWVSLESDSKTRTQVYSELNNGPSKDMSTQNL